MTKYDNVFRLVVVGHSFEYNNHKYAKTSQSQAYNLATNEYVAFGKRDKVIQEYDETTAESVKIW